MQRPQPPTRRRTFELGVATLVGLLTFSIPFLLIEAGRESHPELRVVNVGGRLSTFVMLDDARVLVMNVSDPRDANALLGRIRRPWDAGPSALVSSASPSAGAALLSTLEQTEPLQVIILGLPGAEPEWTAIERLCAERGVQLDYVSRSGTVRHAQAELWFESGDSAAVIVRAGGINIAIGLGGEYLSTQAAVVISDAEPPSSPHTRLLIRSEALTGPPVAVTELLVDRDQSISLVLEPFRVVARGGTVRQPPD